MPCSFTVTLLNQITDALIEGAWRYHRLWVSNCGHLSSSKGTALLPNKWVLAPTNKGDVCLLSQLLAKAHCTQQSYKRQQDVETSAFEKRINIFRDLEFILIKLIPWIKFGWGEGGEEVWKDRDTSKQLETQKAKSRGLGLNGVYLAVCAAWSSLLPRCPAEKMRKNVLRGLNNVQQGSGEVSTQGHCIQHTPGTPWL